MFSLFIRRSSPKRAKTENSPTREADCFGSHVVLTSLSSCRWFAAPSSGPNQNRLLHSAAPPADNSTGFCACTLYLVFKEPTPTEPVTRFRWPSPSSRPSLGEPSKVTTEDLLCQYLLKFSLERSFGDKKIAPHLLRSNHPAFQPGLAYRTADRRLNRITIHALGVGFPRPLRSPGCQRILAEQANRIPNPARAI
jgi:hypothetical protein